MNLLLDVFLEIFFIKVTVSPITSRFPFSGGGFLCFVYFICIRRIKNCVMLFILGSLRNHEGDAEDNID